MTGAETAITVVVVASGGGIVAAWIAARQAFRELVVKRQLDSTDRFLDLVSILDNRVEGGGVGLNKQIATAWLIAEFGKNNDFLRRTAEETLKEYLPMYRLDDNPSLNRALRDALAWLDPKSAEAPSPH